jgi:hypothetical protein
MGLPGEVAPAWLETCGLKRTCLTGLLSRREARLVGDIGVLKPEGVGSAGRLEADSDLVVSGDDE